MTTTKREFWRAIEEQADDPAFRELLQKEFPSRVEAIIDPVERRTFLKLMGASIALAGFSACTQQPPEHIVQLSRRMPALQFGRRGIRHHAAGGT